jgi:hypothetical protein
MTEYNTDPVTVALADLRMRVTDEHGLQCIRVFIEDRAHRHRWNAFCFLAGMTTMAAASTIVFIATLGHP